MVLVTQAQNVQAKVEAQMELVQLVLECVVSSIFMLENFLKLKGAIALYPPFVAYEEKHKTICTKSQILCIKICSYLNMAENVMKITFLKPSQNILGSI